MSERLELDRYDAGLLGNGGGGNVEWWQDYMRAELERAHEFYQDQVAAAREASREPGDLTAESAIDSLTADKADAKGFEFQLGVSLGIDSAEPSRSELLLQANSLVKQLAAAKKTIAFKNEVLDGIEKQLGIAHEDGTTIGGEIANLKFQLAGAKAEYAGLSSDLSDLRAENKRLRAERGWRDIDTAPTDGTEVLLMVERRAGIPGKMLVGHWMPGGHCIEDHPAIDAGWYFWNGCMFDRASKPTHWQPLPLPPEQPHDT